MNNAMRRNMTRINAGRNPRRQAAPKGKGTGYAA
jgi:hypothetical protein